MVLRDSLSGSGTRTGVVRATLVRGELSRLLREQRRPQRDWQALQGKLDALDQRLGQARFAEWSWPFVMAPGAVLDTFATNACATFDLDG